MSSYPGPVQCVVRVHSRAGIDVVVSGTGAVCRLRTPPGGDRCRRIRDWCSVSSAYTLGRGSMSSYPGLVQCVVRVHPGAGIDVVVSGTGAVCR
ncbi:MAG: hypothetical protein WC382_08295, partial [Methanoregulaceae archaeon]